MVATLYVHLILFLQAGNPGASSWDLRSMWSQMSALPRSVVVILFVLSIYSFGVMIDRALMYSAARKQSRVFVQQVAGALKDGKLDEAIAIAERNKKSCGLVAATPARPERADWWLGRRGVLWPRPGPASPARSLHSAAAHSIHPCPHPEPTHS
jgi:hypothetical protein